MGGSGLLLCLFVVAHLGGNLLMYVGPDAYNLYASTLHSQEWLVKSAELGLVVLFGAHIWLAMETNRENREARPQSYAVTKSKQKQPLINTILRPENWMFISGCIFLCFLLLHLADFTFEITMSEEIEGYSYFDKAVIILRNPLSAGVYLVGTIVLGWHLLHAAQSAFQTLGLKHPKYTPAIKAIGQGFAVLAALGFASFPIWANLTSYQPTKLTEQHASEDASHPQVTHQSH